MVVVGHLDVDVKGVLEGVDAPIRPARSLDVFPPPPSEQIVEGLPEPALDGPVSPEIGFPNAAVLLPHGDERVFYLGPLVGKPQKGSPVVLHRDRKPSKTPGPPDGSGSGGGCWCHGLAGQAGKADPTVVSTRGATTTLGGTGGVGWGSSKRSENGWVRSRRGVIGWVCCRHRIFFVSISGFRRMMGIRIRTVITSEHTILPVDS